MRLRTICLCVFVCALFPCAACDAPDDSEVRFLFRAQEFATAHLHSLKHDPLRVWQETCESTRAKLTVPEYEEYLYTRLRGTDPTRHHIRQRQVTSRDEGMAAIIVYEIVSNREYEFMVRIFVVEESQDHLCVIALTFDQGQTLEDSSSDEGLNRDS